MHAPIIRLLCSSSEFTSLQPRPDRLTHFHHCCRSRRVPRVSEVFTEVDIHLWRGKAASSESPFSGTPSCATLALLHAIWPQKKEVAEVESLCWTQIQILQIQILHPDQSQCLLSHCPELCTRMLGYHRR